jgi:ornithine racemase
MQLPRIEIDLAQIQDNARSLSRHYAQRGIALMGVSKVTLGDPAIAQAMVHGGVKFIADSRLENIQKMQMAGVETQFVLLRSALSQASAIVEFADISLNTELATIRELAYYAQAVDRTHKIIVMVELGDLREGVLPGDLRQFIQATIGLKNIAIIGLGCNLACYGGVKPNDEKMQALSDLVMSIEQEFGLNLAIVSGGNSANYDWSESTQNQGRVNNLRLGEALLLGRETLGGKAIVGLHTQAFQLVTEVIESKLKPSVPFGEIGRNAFGEVPQFVDRGIHRRVIIALGRQDVAIGGLTPQRDVDILGASSDHVVLDGKGGEFAIGSEVRFDLDYGGLLAAMTSPFVTKEFV